jgi:hypothetical protein
MSDLSAAAKMSQTPSAGVRLGEHNIDDLGRAVLLLARELWVVKDRQLVTEALLAERGIDLGDAIRDYQPSGALAEMLAAERKALTERLLDALVPGRG